MRFVIDEALEDIRLREQALIRKGEVRFFGQILALLTGILFPMLMYCHVYTVMSGRVRFHREWLAYLLGPFLSLLVCCIVAKWTWGLLRKDLPVRGLATLTPMLFLAAILGWFESDNNYWWYMKSYIVYQDLASYTDIDPSADKGQSFMDAGQVYFREGTEIQASNMHAFRSDSVYCVAPITIQPLWNAGSPDQIQLGGPVVMPESGTVDFWAVGRDCCSTTSREFNCGAVKDPHARAGLRLLRDDERPFYLLAVQAWVAKNCPQEDNTIEGQSKAAPLVCLPARHPLFFFWVQDPLHEVGEYLVKSERLFHQHAFIFLALDVFASLGLSWLFTNLGLK